MMWTRLQSEEERDRIGAKTREALMKRELEEQREQLKERMSREVDKYYEEISNGLENGTIQIDRIEQMLVTKKAQVTELIKEATGQAFSEIEGPTEKKTMSGMQREYAKAKKGGENKDQNNGRGN